MKREKPQNNVLEEEIGLITKNLIALGAGAKLSPSDQHNLQEIDKSKITHVSILEDTTPGAFWGRYIGGALGVAHSQLNSPKHMLDRETIAIVQKRTYLLINQWINHPNNQNKLGLDCSFAFLNSAYSFDWINDTETFNKFSEYVFKISENYSLLEGRIPSRL